MYNFPEWLEVYLLKHTKVEIINIMAAAIELMQQYNGRTIVYCIVSSIEGAECIEDDDGYTYTLPKKGKK